jgi:exopolysaccharide production protein ExoY
MLLTRMDQRKVPEVRIPTIWGLSPLEIHDRYWASRRVQVVRRGEATEVSRRAKLYLLLPPGCLVDFELPGLRTRLRWRLHRLALLRVESARDTRYREKVISDKHLRFVRYERFYQGASTTGPDRRSVQVALTRDAEIARTWSRVDPAQAEKGLVPDFIPLSGNVPLSTTSGYIFDATHPDELMACTTALLGKWTSPSSTVGRLREVTSTAWVDVDAEVDDTASFVGPVWVGAGRTVSGGTRVVGPAILWDDPQARPRPDPVHWEKIPRRLPPRRETFERRIPKLGAVGKRTFDAAFSLVAIVFSLPLYPFVMLAIWVEDGRPFFFVHRRETRGGRRFPCLKFRTMRKDADAVEAALKAQDGTDGPQSHIEKDPRMLRVGDFLRKTKIDRLPQFFNVLLGHMSVVGPRPSPFEENQFCPTWREARLSVRPGITGLWQVRRTRQPGRDFQEWIKYDIEYVESASWRLDLWILWRTVFAVVRGSEATSGLQPHLQPAGPSGDFKDARGSRGGGRR